MKKLKCDYCGEVFFRQEYEIKRQKKHYCSKECCYKSRRKNNVYIEHDNYIEVINNNHSILLDKEDFVNINSKITIRKKEKDNTYYAFILGKSLHRLIMNCPNNKVIDHINHNGLDNRKCNLRICTVADNCRNKGTVKRNKSGIIGVSWCKKLQKWKVTLEKNNKSYHGGYFINIEQAREARKNLELIHYNN